MHVSAVFPTEPHNTTPDILSQAVAEMVRRLRKLHGNARPSNGLILANGGVLTTENAICVSTHPRKAGDPYPHEDMVPSRSAQLAPSIAMDAQGEVIIEVCAFAVLQSSDAF